MNTPPQPTPRSYTADEAADRLQHLADHAKRDPEWLATPTSHLFREGARLLRELAGKLAEKERELAENRELTIWRKRFLEAEAALKAAREDADRYRWLRDQSECDSDDDLRREGIQLYRLPDIAVTWHKADVIYTTLDAAIDAARARQGREG